jgi:hypothetical protein
MPQKRGRSVTVKCALTAKKTGLFICLTRENVDLATSSQSFARTTLKSEKANGSVAKNEVKPSFTLLHLPG